MTSIDIIAGNRNDQVQIVNIQQYHSLFQKTLTSEIVTARSINEQSKYKIIDSQIHLRGNQCDKMEIKIKDYNIKNDYFYNRVFHSFIKQNKQSKMMNHQPTFGIHNAIGTQINFRSNPNKADFPSKSDLSGLNNELKERKKIAQAKIRGKQLRNKFKIDKFQQARLQAKAAIFRKYYELIEKELEVLKVELQSENEYDNDYYSLYKFDYQIRRDDMPGRLLDFEMKLRWVRQSTCYFKYCCPSQSRCYCCCNWSIMWCLLPCICCYKGGLKEDKNQTRLQELYERYEQLMVAENQAVACPP